MNVLKNVDTVHTLSALPGEATDRVRWRRIRRLGIAGSVLALVLPSMNLVPGSGIRTTGKRLILEEECAPPPEQVIPSEPTHTKLKQSASMIGFAYTAAFKKRVDISWKFSPPDGSQPVSADQGVPLVYWPVYSLATDANHLCIAGMTCEEQPKTVIELRTFGNASSNSYQTPGGSVVWVVTPPPQVSASLVLRTSNPALSTIEAILKDQSDPTGSVIVFSWSSRDLYRIDLDSGDAGYFYGNAQEPGLDMEFDVFWSRNHVTDGYIYILAQSSLLAGSVDGWKVVALKDSNRDGAIDEALVMTAAEWEASSYSDASSWQN